MAVTTTVSLDSGLTTLRGAAVSPSGRLAVTYGVDVLVFSLTIWDVATQRPIRQIETSRAPMTVSFTPDETAILGALLSPEDGSAEVIRWPVTEPTGPGEVLHTETGIAGVAMARDTKTVIFRSATGSVTVLETASGRTYPLDPSAEVEQAAVSSYGTLIAMATAKDIWVVRVSDQVPISGVINLPSYVPGPVQAVDCTEGAVLAASANTVSFIYGQSGLIFTGSDWVRQMALSTGGVLLAVAQQDRVVLIDLQNRATVDQIPVSSPVQQLTFSLDDTLLVTTHADNVARLWDVTGTGESGPAAAGSAEGSGGPARFDRLSRESVRVLGFADGLRRARRQDRVHLDELILGLAQDTSGFTQQLAGRAGVDLAGVMLGLVNATEPVPPDLPSSYLESLPAVSGHTEQALDRAFRLAGPTEQVRPEDLLRGALSVTDCATVQALAGRGFDLAALDAVPPPPAARAPLLAGAAADTVPEPGEGRVREADRLGVAAEVEMLVSILMASDTPLPLAVGLFGDWGSGKSFFMALMQERIDELARLSSQGRPEAEPFCGQVRQVRFNAWHYVDTNLWASLAATLFDELARPGTPDETQAKLTELDAARQRAAAAREERELRESEVAQLAAAADRPAAAVKSAVPVAIRAVRRGDLRQDLRTAQDPEKGSPGTVLLLTTLGEVHGTAEKTRALWRLFQEEVLYRRRWVTLAALLVLLGLGWFAAVAASWPAGIKVLTFAGAVAAGLSPALSGALRVLYLAREAREARELPLVSKRSELAAARARERSAGQQVALREQELARLRDKGLQLQEFVRERAASADYRGRLGVISQVRRDFEQLVALVPGRRPPTAGQAGAAQVAAVAEAVAERVPEVQRIILYVDDLDRCPSGKVVEVLQAVHLLLAFKLFVVVVGVDSGWLERSLQAHYREMLEDPGSYLEKIFQIPFILQRMTPARYRDLIEGLTPLAPTSNTAAVTPPAPASPPAPVAPKSSVTPEITATPETPPGPVARAAPREAGSATADAVPAAASAVPETTPAEPALPRPEALVISAEERTLLGHLGGIVPTPRAAKRLVNIYRMLRVSVPDGELAAFQPGGGDEYQAVILLLALLVGRPAEAGKIFGALRAADGGADVWQVLGAHGVALTELHDHITVTSAEPYRRWARRVARFSFRLGTVPPGDDW